MSFDFCFPLKGDKDFPETASIFIKDLPVFEAIQGRFHGNYVFSHYFWPDVLKLSSGNYQKDHPEILEIFNDNPEMGGKPQGIYPPRIKGCLKIIKTTKMNLL